LRFARVPDRDLSVVRSFYRALTVAYIADW
jgi:hypothetical protein